MRAGASALGRRPAEDRLAVVLRLRRLDEDRARLALGAELAREAEIRRRLEAATAEHEATCAALAGVLERRTSAAAMAEASAALEVVERRRRRLADDLEAVARAVSEARAALGAASRRREAVERLRSRRLVESRRRTERRLERELTEIALVRRAWALVDALG